MYQNHGNPANSCINISVWTEVVDRQTDQPTDRETECCIIEDFLVHLTICTKFLGDLLALAVKTALE